MGLTKKDVVEQVAEATGLAINESTDAVEALLEIIKATLASGEDVLVSGFGRFCVKCKNERKGRNPATGEEAILPARRVVTFKCSGKLRERVNGKQRGRQPPKIKGRGVSPALLDMVWIVVALWFHGAIRQHCRLKIAGRWCYKDEGFCWSCSYIGGILQSYRQNHSILHH